MYENRSERIKELASIPLAVHEYEMYKAKRKLAFWRFCSFVSAVLAVIAYAAK
jgi:hypothetical protein